ncbi:hypothetical protein [Polaromonas sp. P5_D5]
MKQLDEMDLTLYLQTEGRRMAAELRGKTLPDAENQSPTPPDSCPPAARHPSAHGPAQQQCATPAPARSLSEALQRMGVTGSPSRRV